MLILPLTFVHIKCLQLIYLPQQCFPNFFACGTLLASTSNHTTLHSCSRKYRMSQF